MKLIFAPAAENDLESVADYIAENNPAKAISFVNELRERCLSLTTFPLRHPVYGEADDMTVRKYPYKDYIIYYGVENDTIYIFHIWHAAKRQPSF